MPLVHCVSVVLVGYPLTAEGNLVLQELDAHAILLTVLPVGECDLSVLGFVEVESEADWNGFVADVCPSFTYEGAALPVEYWDSPIEVGFCNDFVDELLDALTHSLHDEGSRLDVLVQGALKGVNLLALLVQQVFGERSSRVDLAKFFVETSLAPRLAHKVHLNFLGPHLRFILAFPCGFSFRTQFLVLAVEFSYVLTLIITEFFLIP